MTTVLSCMFAIYMSGFALHLLISELAIRASATAFEKQDPFKVLLMQVAMSAVWPLMIVVYASMIWTNRKAQP